MMVEAEKVDHHEFDKDDKDDKDDRDGGLSTSKTFLDQRHWVESRFSSRILKTSSQINQLAVLKISLDIYYPTSPK